MNTLSRTLALLLALACLTGVLVPGVSAQEPFYTVSDSTDPTEVPTDPTEESTEPSEDPTDPTEESTEPSEDLTDPTEESTEPTDPTEDPTDPTDPTDPPQEPSPSIPLRETIVYGYSGEGRELLAYRFGTGENVLVMGFAIHGFEDNFDRDGQCLVDCAHAMMDYLSENYLVDGYNWTVYILPCMNPDGLASGYTNNGPGRCTTTYLRADGTLATDKGIDLNRCFPTNFWPQTDSRNYTTSRPLAALEAVALADFIQDVKGTGKNVLIDVHGWLEKAISYHDWLLDIFAGNFEDIYRDTGDNRPGFLISYADALGYDSLLMELPRDIRSMDDYHNSDIEARMAESLDEILLNGQPRCGGEHNWTTESVAPACTLPGYDGKVCTLCGIRSVTTVPPTGHTPDPSATQRVEPTATRPGSVQIPCAVCGRVAQEYSLPRHFIDIIPGSYYADALDYCFANGIASGTSPTTFSPNKTCTRGQIVTFLWRAMGCPEPVSTENPFRDVKESAYYYDAVLWAYEQGITAGTGPTVFAPDLVCNRAQIVTFLWRAMGAPESQAEVSPFTDVPENAYYAQSALWAWETGVTSGVDADSFAPNRGCIRAQAVTFLYRALTIQPPAPEEQT